MPRVALETAVLTHGLPYPENERTVLRLEAAVRDEGAEPRTVGVVRGAVRCGLSPEEIRHLAAAADARKVSLRDLPLAAAQGWSGGTTVAATLHVAAQHGVRVFATGGIGGVHRSLTGRSYDVSADLGALARYAVAVVCAGAKAILDLPATREALETRGVTVLGYGTDELPAFYSRSSGLPADARVDTPEAAAAVIQARAELGLAGGVLVGVPVPAEAEVPRDEIEPAIARAVEEAEQRGLRSAEVTPFLLGRLAELTGARSLRANLALLEQNARVAARIARALASL
ncbi:MAG: pseudouridine-5'-phosphate glycosidase [Rhodothermales bacterium]|nr:pseudouridine-5'-phosphate glycosidase [Rhodothermales bacterium]